MSSPPFINIESGELDLRQIGAEAFRLAGLIVLFGALAALVFSVSLVLALSSQITLFFTVLTQFILAVGTGVVLIYVVARGMQLAEE